MDHEFFSYPIPKVAVELPCITTEQMIEVDRLMIQEYKIVLIQMMENAGRALALLAREKFLDSPDSFILVMAGTGGNGGGALVCARRLANWGYAPVVCISDPARLKAVPHHQYIILQRQGVSIISPEDLDAYTEVPALIIDGIIGYSISGDPRGNAQKMIEWANQQATRILSLDTPSGIDLSTGTRHQPSVRANATLTLALPKMGLFKPEVIPQRGMLYLADISVPPQLYHAIGITQDLSFLFRESDLVEIL